MLVILILISYVPPLTTVPAGDRHNRLASINHRPLANNSSGYPGWDGPGHGPRRGCAVGPIPRRSVDLFVNTNHQDYELYLEARIEQYIYQNQNRIRLQFLRVRQGRILWEQQEELVHQCRNGTSSPRHKQQQQQHTIAKNQTKKKQKTHTIGNKPQR